MKRMDLARLVSGIAPEPSAFISQILVIPLLVLASLPSMARFEVNAMLLPSGDHSGSKQRTPLMLIFVSGVASEPSEFTIQMLLLREHGMPSPLGGQSVLVEVQNHGR